jgi:hypothetical protein
MIFSMQDRNGRNGTNKIFTRGKVVPARTCNVTVHVTLDDHVATIEENDSLLYAVEDPEAKLVFKETWNFLRQEDLTASSVGMRLRPSLPAKRKDAAVSGFAWMLRKVGRRNGKAA